MRKTCQDTDIYTKIIKKKSDVFADFLFFNLSNCIPSSVFPSNLENAEITPVHNKNSKNAELNYRRCLELLRKDTVKISIWFSKRIEYKTMLVGHNRKMASEFR